MDSIANDSKIRADVEQAPELFAPEVVLTLAKQAGYDGEVAPKIAIFDEENGFPEATAFFCNSKGTGYYRVTEKGCTCPDFRFRRGPVGALCKHQKQLLKLLGKPETEPEKPHEPQPHTTIGEMVGETDEELRAKYEDEHIGNPYIDVELSFPAWKRKYLRLEEVNDTLKTMGMDDPGYWNLEGECSELCGALGY